MCTLKWAADDITSRYTAHVAGNGVHTHIAALKPHTSPCRLLNKHPAPCTSLPTAPPRCSSDGEEFIASGRDNLIHVYDAETMDPISILDGHACDVMFCRVSGDRQYAISGDSDGLVFV